MTRPAKSHSYSDDLGGAQHAVAGSRWLQFSNLVTLPWVSFEVKFLAALLVVSSVLVIRVGRLDLIIAFCYMITLLLGGFTWFRMTSKDEASSTFVPLLFASSFAIRAFLAIFISLFIKEYVTYDAPLYESFGRFWSDYWHGLSVAPPLSAVPNVQLTEQIVGIQYFLSGNNMFVPDITNAFIGALIPVVVYNIGHRIFRNELIGRAASVFAALNAACIVWSAIAVRDIFIVFFVTLSLSEVTKLLPRINIMGLLRLLVWTYCVYSFRPYAAMILVTAIGIATAVLLTTKPLVRVLAVVLVIGLFCSVFAVSGIRTVLLDIIQTQTDQLNTARLVVTYQTAQDPGYAPGVNYKSINDILFFVPQGLFYFWAGPLLFSYGARQILFAIPEVISWYVTFWYGFRGFVMLRGRNGYVLPLTMFFFIGSILLSIVCGNYPEVIRVRSMLSAPLQVVAGLGWVYRRNKLLQRPLGL